MLCSNEFWIKILVIPIYTLGKPYVKPWVGFYLNNLTNNN